MEMLLCFRRAGADAVADLWRARRRPAAEGRVMSHTPLLGRLAVVTGGTRGIGRAIVERLLADGAEVVAVGRTERGQGPAGSRYAAVDLEYPASVETFAARLEALAPDILINNAGINKNGPFSELTMADYQRLQQVNTAAPFRLCQAVLPGMRARGWGRILNITSIYGAISRAGRAPYSASKFALDGMSLALAAEVASQGILVNCIAPGLIDTDLSRGVLGEEGMARMVKEIPIGRFAKPEEVAAFAAWMVGPENTYICGQNFLIDGGFARN